MEHYYLNIIFFWLVPKITLQKSKRTKIETRLDIFRDIACFVLTVSNVFVLSSRRPAQNHVSFSFRCNIWSFPCYWANNALMHLEFGRCTSLWYVQCVIKVSNLLDLVQKESWTVVAPTWAVQLGSNVWSHTLSS